MQCALCPFEQPRDGLTVRLMTMTTAATATSLTDQSGGYVARHMNTTRQVGTVCVSQYRHSMSVCRRETNLSVVLFARMLAFHRRITHISPSDTRASSGVHDQLCHSFLPPRFCSASLHLHFVWHVSAYLFLSGMGTRRQWPRPRRDRGVSLPRPRRDRDVWPHQSRRDRDVQILRRDRDETFAGLET